MTPSWPELHWITLRTFTGSSTLLCVHIHLLTLVFVTPFRATVPVVVDDREHYFRSFKLFMDAVRPKYAIPFASNHCHLHEEVFDLNTYVSKPNELAGYLAGDQGSRPWELVTMLPGSSWSSKEGFKLANQDAFEFYEQKLLAYRNEVADRLDHYEQKELRVEISDDIFA